MIRRILVANRGEIARRVFRTCREMGISTVAVFSDPDWDELHIHEADEAINLPGASPADTYLNIEALLAAARRSGADAIHPGYGFLAENAAFARAVEETGRAWIGPPAKAIEVMGSKLESKALVGEIGVPTLGGLDLSGLDETATLAAAAQLGYPVLVKASAGGGGKGMRIVREAVDLGPAIAAARREASAAFGDDTLLLETYLEAPRHIEVQIFADGHGNLVSLFERECSIQRRYQKIIEEAPSPVVDDDLRERMGEAAMAVARAVSYVGAGTVEFLFQDGAFFFLEMNTRLQVEHPVTEMITGLDMVRLQIMVADGERLPTAALSPALSGHAVEARLYAEDPAHDFLPAPGRLHRFRFADHPGVRVDSGVEDGSVVSVHYDPLLAKVLSHAPTRREAISALANALRKAQIHGSTTNRALLVRILEDEQFAAGEIDTHFLDRRDLAVMAAPLAGERDARLAAVAAALADQAHRSTQRPVLGTIGGAWRNSPSQPQRVTYRWQASVDIEVAYWHDRRGMRLEGSDDFGLISCSPGMVEFELDGVLNSFSVNRAGGVRYVDGGGPPVELEELPRFPRTEMEEAPGSLRAPMPGKVIRVEVSPGDEVSEGQLLMVLEAMKMEHALKAPTAGRVGAVNASPGDQVEAESILAVIQEA